MCSFSLHCTGQNYLGTEFRAMFMRNLEQPINGLPSFEFSVYAPTGAEVTVTYGNPDDPFFQQQSGSVVPGGQLTISFPDQILEQEDYFVAQTRSFHITASAPIRLYALHNRIYFAEGTAVLPLSACGSDYRVVTFQGNNQESQVSILAYSDNTELTIIPSVTTPAGTAGIPFALVLQAGEAYTLAAPGADLTQTRIFSPQGTPFAVFAGHRRVLIGACDADSHLYEQLVPLEDWGTGFALIPPELSGGELVRITAAFDGTEIFEGCDELLFEMDAGESVTFLNTAPRLIASSQPVQVATFMRGALCTVYFSGDPNMRIVLPLEKANTSLKLKTDFSFTSTFGSNQFEFFHLVMPTSQTGDLTLNGNPVDWTPFSTQPEISFARVNADNIQTLTTVTAASPFWAEYLAMVSYDAISMSLGSDRVMALPPLGITQVSLGPDFSICPGTTATLQVSNSLQAIWQDGSQQNSYVLSEPGTYFVTVEGTCGMASDTVVVDLFAPAEVQVDSAFFACAGQEGTTAVAALQGYQYQWSNGASGPQLTVGTAGTYQVTATSPEGCTATAETDFINLPLPTVIIEGQTFLCEASSTVLVASPQEGTQLWSTGAEGPLLTIVQPGFYTVVLTDANGCIDSASVNINLAPLPFIFANDTTVCAGELVTLRASSPNGELMWLGFAPDEKPEAGPGSYTVEATNTCGTTEATVTVIEDPCLCDAQIPNIFTPNGDGRNDTFEPSISCAPIGFDLSIYDRWGREVFRSTDIAMLWTGNAADGLEHSEGVYYYVIKYFNSLRSIPTPLIYKGWLTLTR